MVLDDTFVWNGKTYDSLSHVAFAITGTRWNGPRFTEAHQHARHYERGETADHTGQQGTHAPQQT